MTVVAIVSDTHLPRGARRIPDYCVERMSAADLIVHAGDFSVAGVLADLRALGPPVVAVHGNVDELALRQRAARRRPWRRSTACGSAWCTMPGPHAGRLERMRACASRMRMPSSSATRTSRCTRRPQDGFQIFNPGSPTDRRRQPRHTMGIATVGDGRVVLRARLPRLTYLRLKRSVLRATASESPRVGPSAWR